MAHRRQGRRVVFQQVQELLVPPRVHDAEIRAMQLVRQPARAQHDDVQLARVALHRAPDRLAQPIAAPGGGQGVLDDVHRQRHDRHLPRIRQQQRQRRQHTMVQRHLLAQCRVELVIHQAAREVPGEVRMTRQRIERPCGPPLVGQGETLCHAQGEGRVGVEEEMVHVVVVGDHHHVGLARRQPGPGLGEPVEDRLPQRLVLAAAIEHPGEGRGVRTADPADDAAHQAVPWRRPRSACKLAMNAAKSCPRICAPISISVPPPAMAIFASR